MTSPSTLPTPAEMTLCNQCWELKPESEYRLKYKNSNTRMKQCRSCHNQAERVRQYALRQRLSQEQMTRAFSRLRAESDNARVVALCDQMTRRFGGVDGFVRAWEACLARDLQKGGNAAFRHLAAVIRLAQYCEQTKPSPQSMTEEELELAIESLGGEVPIG